MDRRSLDALWFTGAAVPGLAFKLNDGVVVTRGEFAGRVAVVISAELWSGDPLYAVEFGDSGQSTPLHESSLRAA